mgnify:CR=1 FL=1
MKILQEIVALAIQELVLVVVGITIAPVIDIVQAVAGHGILPIVFFTKVGFL